jgi:hypothetical protein
VGRPVEDLATRFERQVDRTGEHHLWLGTINRSRGTGQIRVNKVVTTAHRVAWELAHGALSPSERVLACKDDPACVRVDHLRLEDGTETTPQRRARSRKGTGSMRAVRPGTWELRVTAGRWDNGRPRSLTRTVSAKTEAAAASRLKEFVDEMSAAQLPKSQDLRDLTVDEAMERFLTEYLADEKGRSEKTIGDYRYLHRRWFSPCVGAKALKRIDAAAIDALFGDMRQAGLSASRLNQARSL